MLAFTHSLNVLLPLVYGGALLAYAGFFRSEERGTGRVATTVLAGGLALHAVYLVARGIAVQHFPIMNFLEALSLVAFCIALIYFAIERRAREGNTGVFFVAIVFALQLVSSMFVEDTRSIHRLLSNPLFGIHTTLTVLGISALAVAGIYGMLYLMLAMEMKRHRFGVIYDRLPPLDTLEIMATFALTAGVVVLGGGILLGHLWAARTLGTFFPLDAKVIVTDLTWAVYALALLAVRVRGWSGFRMGHFALWTSLAYFSSTVLVNVFASSFHKFQT